MKFDRLFPHSGFYRIKFYCLIFYRSISVFQLFKTLQSRSLFRCSGTTPAFRPFKFHSQNTLSLSFRCWFHLFSLRLQFKKPWVVRVVSIHFSMTDLQNTICNSVKKIPVVSYHNNGSFIGPKIFFQPSDHRFIQMVRRLIQQKYVKIIWQYFCKHNPFFLSSW